MSEPFSPRLWDVEPGQVTHIAGSCITMFGRYMRQRCEWCGVVLLEYDLARIAVPVGQPGPPASWAPGVLVRVDGALSAEVEPVVEEEAGATHIRLPMDACAFSPLTQVM